MVNSPYLRTGVVEEGNLVAAWQRAYLEDLGSSKRLDFDKRMSLRLRYCYNLLGNLEGTVRLLGVVLEDGGGR